MNLQFGIAVTLVVAAGFLLANKAGAGPILWTEHSVASQRAVMVSGVSFVFNAPFPRLGLSPR